MTPNLQSPPSRVPQARALAMECCHCRSAIPGPTASSRRAVLLHPDGARRRLLVPAPAFWGSASRGRLVSFGAPPQPRCHKMYVPGNSTFLPLISIATNRDIDLSINSFTVKLRMVDFAIRTEAVTRFRLWGGLTREEGGD